MEIGKILLQIQMTKYISEVDFVGPLNNIARTGHKREKNYYLKVFTNTFNILSLSSLSLSLSPANSIFLSFSRIY